MRPMIRRMRASSLVVLAACLGCGESERAAPSAREASFVDSQRCQACHAAEWERWTGSDHDLAMQAATEETVLGDFDGATFEHFGVVSRFFRRDGRFFVHTDGPDGALGDFEIRYTFGVDPLQQYLIELPGGRLQALTIAWDAERSRWYHLYPDEPIAPDDALHWTGRYQRWNAMCADCHSTRVAKNYDAESDSYATTWHEIDVGCQACHGPGSEHLEWAERYAASAPPGAGEPAADDPNDDHRGLTTRLVRAEAPAQIDTCAPCHSRRTQIDPDWVHGEPFLESFFPERLHAGLYHADGQIEGEVYEYGSFAQTKMHQAGVACSDCHDPHSLELIVAGDALCMQCHTEFPPLDRFPDLAARNYATSEHHHHPPESEGARCVACHMPARTYMGIDARRDHSFRVPRPDLSLAIGTPNACGDCHADEGPEWAAERVAEWFGPQEEDEHFARAFAGARQGDPSTFPELIALALDPERPPIVRATALELLRPFGPQAVQATSGAFQDPDPLVRSAAVRMLEALSATQRLQALTTLEDEALGVRLESARVMASGLSSSTLAQLGEQWNEIFDRATAEYRAAQALSADLPSAHLNLAVLAEDLGELELAEREYELALEQDPRFLPARFNLATFLNRQGRNRGALAVLEKGLALAPDEGELYYSLGLLQAEMGEHEAAAESLLAAAARLPSRRGVHRNAGLALQRVGRLAEAERILEDGARLDPHDPELQHALAYVFTAAGERAKALAHAARLFELSPESPEPEELIRQMEAELAGEEPR